MVDKYTTAREITQKYLNGDISELDFRRRISNVMDIPQQESKESYQIKSILKPEPVHIVQRGTHTTLCSQDVGRGGLKFKWMHEIGCGVKFVWLHEMEEYRKKLVVGNELDMPTCPLCVSVLESQGIKIVKGYSEKEKDDKINPKNKWTTKDGTEIDISKMSGHHLTNTIDWLERSAKILHLEHIKSGFDTLNYVSGEMAEVSIESELNQISEMDDIEFLRQYTQYEELLKEAERRGLKKNQ